MRKNLILSRPGREDSWTTKINRVGLFRRPPPRIEPRTPRTTWRPTWLPIGRTTLLAIVSNSVSPGRPTGRGARGSRGSGILSRGVNLEEKTLSLGRREDPAGHSWNK